MLRELFSVLVLVVLGSISLSLAFMIHRMMKSQNEMIHNLTAELKNLAASKDFRTYAEMSALGQSGSEVTQETPLPLNDEALAHHLAERYANSGINPRFAYSEDDNPLNDFGGPQAFH